MGAQPYPRRHGWAGHGLRLPVFVRAQGRRPPKAARILGVAIPIAKEHLSGFQQAHPLLAAATIAAATGRERIAARLLGAFNQYGKWTPFVNESRENEHLASQLHDRLGAAIVEDELARGARLTIAQALQLAEDTIVAMTRDGEAGSLAPQGNVDVR